MGIIGLLILIVVGYIYLIVKMGMEFGASGVIVVLLIFGIPAAMVYLRVKSQNTKDEERNAIISKTKQNIDVELENKGFTIEKKFVYVAMKLKFCLLIHYQKE